MSLHRRHRISRHCSPTLADHLHSGDRENDPEQSEQETSVEHTRQQGASHRPESRRKGEKRGDTQICHALGHVPRRTCRRGRRHRHERSPDCKPNVEVKDQREHRHDDEASAEAEQRAEYARQDRYPHQH